MRFSTPSKYSSYRSIGKSAGKYSNRRLVGMKDSYTNTPSYGSYLKGNSSSQKKIRRNYSSINCTPSRRNIEHNYTSNSNYQSVKPSIPRPKDKLSIKKEYRLDSNARSFQRGYSSIRKISILENLRNPVIYKNLEKEGFSMKTIEKEEKINEDMIKMGKALITLCKCIKESIGFLKIHDFGRAKFSLVSKQWEFAEMDWEKFKGRLEELHGIDFYKVGDDGMIIEKELVNVVA